MALNDTRKAKHVWVIKNTIFISWYGNGARSVNANIHSLGLRIITAGKCKCNLPPLGSWLPGLWSEVEVSRQGGFQQEGSGLNVRALCIWNLAHPSSPRIKHSAVSVFPIKFSTVAASEPDSTQLFCARWRILTEPQSERCHRFRWSVSPKKRSLRFAPTPR